MSFHFLWLLHLESDFQKCVKQNQLLASKFTDALKLREFEIYANLFQKLSHPSSLQHPGTSFSSSVTIHLRNVTWALPSLVSPIPTHDSLKTQLALFGAESIVLFLNNYTLARMHALNTQVDSFLWWIWAFVLFGLEGVVGIKEAVLVKS